MPPEAASLLQPPDYSLMELAVYAALGLIGLLFTLTLLAVMTLPLFFLALLGLDVALRGLRNLPDPVGKLAKIAGLVFRSLRRNLLRTALTYVALFVLTGMLTFIYGIIATVQTLTQDKEDSQLVILTERYSIPSMMPPGYATQLKGVIQSLPKESQPADLDANFMTWSFVATSLDPAKTTQENSLLLFALDPASIKSGMMASQGLSEEDLGPEQWSELLRVLELVARDKRNIVVGEDKLKIIGKQVGDQIKMYGLNYKDIEFEATIVGAFPSGTRLGGAAAMRYDYLLSKLDDYKAKKGTAHANADRCLNLVWVRMPNKKSFERLAEVVSQPGTFGSPAAKMETFSAIVSSVLEPFKDILWGLKVIIMPAIVAIMCLVIAITITIGVRERWTEMAVLKVLGFQPWQVMGMIVSEAVLIGVFGGMLSTWAVTFLPMAIRWLTHQFGTRINFFEQLKSDPDILWMGPLLGVSVGLIGAALPSWNARKVKVSEVFAQVA